MKVTMSYDANAAYNSDSDVPGPGMPGGQGYDGLEYGGAPRGAASPDDLSLPLYGATFGQAVKRFFKNYVKFSGRASRSEFWFAYLFTILVGIIPMLLGFAGSTIATLSASGDSYNSTPVAGHFLGHDHSVHCCLLATSARREPRRTLLFSLADSFLRRDHLHRPDGHGAEARRAAFRPLSSVPEYGWSITPYC